MPRRNPCTRFTQLVRGFLRNDKYWVAQIVSFFALVGGLSAQTYPQIVADAAAANYPLLPYSIARLSGAFIRLGSIFLLFPVSKVLMNVLYGSSFAPYLNLDRSLDNHRIIGGIFLSISTAFHVGGHYYADPQNFFQRPGYTGYALIFALTFPLAGVFILRPYLQRHIKATRNWSYGTTVVRVHQGGAVLFAASYACHRFNFGLWPYVAGSGGAFLLDKLVVNVFYTKQTRIKTIRRLPGTHLLLLVLDRPKDFKNALPGQYAQLKFSGEGFDAWYSYAHSFTIVYEDERKIVFIIQTKGTATQALAKCADHNTQHPDVTIAGPFGSPMSSLYYKHGTLVVLATGVGITPFLSLLYSLAKSGLREPALEIHFSQSGPGGFEPCIEALSKLAESNPHARNILKSVNFYLTQASPQKQHLRTEILERLNYISSIRKITNLRFLVDDISPMPAPSSDQASINISELENTLAENKYAEEPLLPIAGLDPLLVSPPIEIKKEKAPLPRPNCTSTPSFFFPRPSSAPKVIYDDTEQLSVSYPLPTIAENICEFKELNNSSTRVEENKENKENNVNTKTAFLFDDPSTSTINLSGSGNKITQPRDITISIEKPSSALIANNFFVNVNVHFGRTNFERIIRETKADTVSICSNSQLAAEVRTACNEENKRCIMESFV